MPELPVSNVYEGSDLDAKKYQELLIQVINQSLLMDNYYSSIAEAL